MMNYFGLGAFGGYNPFQSSWQPNDLEQFMMSTGADGKMYPSPQQAAYYGGQRQQFGFNPFMASMFNYNPYGYSPFGMQGMYTPYFNPFIPNMQNIDFGNYSGAPQATQTSIPSTTVAPGAPTTTQPTAPTTTPKPPVNNYITNMPKFGTQFERTGTLSDKAAQNLGKIGGWDINTKDGLDKYNSFLNQAKGAGVTTAAGLKDYVNTQFTNSGFAVPTTTKKK